LKLDDVYRFELVKFIHQLNHGTLPKIYEKGFQIVTCAHSFQTRFANNQRFLQTLEKRLFLL